MRRLVTILPVLLLAGCGSVDERPECTASGQCAAGTYCALTPDGGVCWPDAVAPQVGQVSVTCDTIPCQRDARLTVEVAASDDAELAGVEVVLDLDPSRAVPLARAGGAWTGELPLRGWPFAAFSRAVVVTARARDGAGNVATAASAPLQVTRLRWSADAKAGSTASLSPPALQPDGTLVVGNAAHELLFLTPGGVQAAAPLPVGTGAISSVAVGDRAIWVGSEDNAVRAVALDRSAVLAGVTVNVDGPIKGGLAVLSLAGEEWAFAGGEGGRLGAAGSVPGSYSSTPVSSYVGAPLVTGPGAVCATTSAAISLLKCFSFDGALAESWSVAVGSGVVTAPALDASASLWTGSFDAELHKTSSTGTTTPLATLGDSVVESPVVLASGDVVVGDQGGALHRFTNAGTRVWDPAPNLGGIPLAPLALSGGPARLVVATRNGSVHALADDGTTLWSGAVAPGTTLRGSNVSLPSAETPVTSTAYFTAANGKVHAVVVDGTLDTAAPWPKAFRDRRNRSNAGVTP